MEGPVSPLKFQIQRMVSLFVQEMAEYERGRSLQVLQPPLSSLLEAGAGQGGGPLLARAASCDGPGGGHAGALAGVPAPAPKLAPDAHTKEEPSPAIKQPPQQQQANATAASTPMLVTPQLVQQLPLHTPISREGSGQVLAALTPAQQLPTLVPLLAAGAPLLGCAAAAAAAATPQQQQMQQQQQPPGPAAEDAATPAPLATPLVAPAADPLANGGGSRRGKRAGYSIEPEALKRLVQRQLGSRRLQPGEAQQAASAVLHQPHSRLRHQQQHRSRSLTRAPQLHAGEAPESPGAAVGPPAAAAGLPLQFHAGLESPDSCLALRLPCSDLDQAAIGLELDHARIFGSAQKRLRLSLCDEAHAQLPPPDLAAALTSPVVLRPSAAFHGGGADGGAPAAQTPASGAGAAAARPVLATPSKFFAGSPIGGAGASGGPDSVGAGGPARERQPAAATVTPSKFLLGSPVALAPGLGKQGGRTPETPLLGAVATPLLWGHGMDGQQQQHQQKQQLGSGCPLRASSRPLAQDASPQPSGWVPVGEGGNAVPAATPDPATGGAKAAASNAGPAALPSVGGGGPVTVGAASRGS